MSLFLSGMFRIYRNCPVTRYEVQSMKRSQKLGLTIFSLLLWAQLLFGVGLMFSRYRLILNGQAIVFSTNLTPEIKYFSDFTSNYCPVGAPILYLTVIERGANSKYVRYEVYPNTVTRRLPEWNLPPSEDDLNEVVASVFGADFQTICLVADGLPVELPDVGERFTYSPSQYLIILPD